MPGKRAKRTEAEATPQVARISALSLHRAPLLTATWKRVAEADSAGQDVEKGQMAQAKGAFPKIVEP